MNAAEPKEGLEAFDAWAVSEGYDTRPSSIGLGYAENDTTAACHGFQAGWNARDRHAERSGGDAEPVAYMHPESLARLSRHRKQEPDGYAYANAYAHAFALSDPGAFEYEPLYTHPPRASVDDVRDAARYRFIRCMAGKSSQEFGVVENAAFVSRWGCEHNFDLNIDAAMAGEVQS